MTYGNGTLLVSWFTKRSTVLAARAHEIPSGIDSNRIAARERVTDGHERRDRHTRPGRVSIDGCVVLKPLLLTANAVVVADVMAAARAAQARMVRPLMLPSKS